MYINSNESVGLFHLFKEITWYTNTIRLFTHKKKKKTIGQLNDMAIFDD